MGQNFTYKVDNCNLTVENIHCLRLDYALDCGQSFRWEKNNGHWQAVVGTHFGDLEERINKDGTVDITFYNCTKEEFESFWAHYLDLDRDYDEILNCYKKDKYLSKAIDEFYGIRILNQDPWEALCSFIISQNNNIPRIKGIISRLCETYGKKLPNGQYSFPSAETISKLEPDDLAPLRAGFRNKYIIDAARKVAEGTVDLDKIKELPLDEAEAELLKIKGVGPKVAQCALLYGLGQIDAFPIDVWVKKIMADLYPKGLPACTKDTRGIAQQYLFHWYRNK